MEPNEMSVHDEIAFIYAKLSKREVNVLKTCNELSYCAAVMELIAEFGGPEDNYFIKYEVSAESEGPLELVQKYYGGEITLEEDKRILTIELARMNIPASGIDMV